jgi:transcriptional regulator GlxA family with amidase domain
MTKIRRIQPARVPEEAVVTEYPEYRFPKVSRLPPLRAGERRRRVVFVASRHTHPLELIGPMNVFRVANFVLEHSGRSDLGYDIEVVASRAGLMYQLNGLKIVLDAPYHRLRGPVDTLLFSPMEFEDLFGRRDGFLRWVARMSRRVRRIGTICVATYILAEAGVLEGCHVTTHWDVQHDFAERYPGVILDIDPIYVKDGHVYTAAGATSGIDMTLALIEEDFGREVALRVAQALVLFLKRPGSQAQFSVQLAARLPEGSNVADLQSYIYEHLAADLRLDALAGRVGMSPRNFARVFTREVGVSPGRFVEQCRIERARQWLADSPAPLSEIAERCGYRTSDGMRVAFERHLDVSPRAYRRRFSTARAS